MANYEQLQELMNRESCDKYYITIDHKTKLNHTAQALVALHALNFSYDDMQVGGHIITMIDVPNLF
jgi:hypothetical protein